MIADKPNATPNTLNVVIGWGEVVKAKFRERRRRA